MNWRLNQSGTYCKGVSENILAKVVQCPVPEIGPRGQRVRFGDNYQRRPQTPLSGKLPADCADQFERLVHDLGRLIAKQLVGARLLWVAPQIHEFYAQSLSDGFLCL